MHASRLSRSMTSEGHARASLARRTMHMSLGVIDSLKVGAGAAEKHSMGHTPLLQRRTPERVDA